MALVGLHRTRIRDTVMAVCTYQVQVVDALGGGRDGERCGQPGQQGTMDTEGAAKTF